MQEAIDAHPDAFLGYWVINPNDPEAVARDLDTFGRRRGFVGLKFWPDYHLVPVTSPKYAPALEYADAHGLLVLVHTFGESPFDSPGMLGEVGAPYPRARFLMGHSGYGEWEKSAAIARELPNVYLDLTSVFQALDFSQMPGGSLMPRAPALSPHVNGLVEYLVETAGSARVVFGSDLPWVAPCHFKDKLRGRRVWHFPPLGGGHVDFAMVLRLFRREGYLGPYCVEVEFRGHPWPPPAAVNRALRKSYRYLNRLGLS
jgi:predicted TIM-barrel fold metal-dependent hydrolase